MVGLDAISTVLLVASAQQRASIEYRGGELVSPLTDAGKANQALEMINSYKRCGGDQSEMTRVGDIGGILIWAHSAMARRSGVTGTHSSSIH